MPKKLVCFKLALFCLSARASDEKARKIADEMINRKGSQTLISKSILFTCTFKLVDKKRTCSSGKRKKEFSSFSSKRDKGGVEKSISILSYPQNEVGVSFLQIDGNETQSSGSQQFVYLPALAKTKEIVSADQKGPKKGTLFGSEIAYEEMEKTYLDDYTYSWVGEETIQGRDTQVIMMRPTKKHEPRTSYTKSKVWVDQKTSIPLKNELYDKRGELYKTYFNRSLEQIESIWFSKQQIVVNHQESRMSMLKQSAIKPNTSLDESLVSVRALSDKGIQAKLLELSYAH